MVNNFSWEILLLVHEKFFYFYCGWTKKGDLEDDIGEGTYPQQCAACTRCPEEFSFWFFVK